MSSTRLVFRAAERAVPALQRGWRTPDPSPTRGAADLPGCTWNLCCMEDADEPATPKLVGGRRREEVCPRVASRTPSPEPVHVAESTSVRKLPSGQWADWSFDLKEDMLSGAAQSEDSEPEPASSPVVSPASCNDASQSPTPPPPPPPMFVLMPYMASTDCRAVPPAPGIWTCGGSGCEEETPSEAQADVVGLPDGCPSKGSVGHPFTCAEFCKYAKKARGCKDGAACDHCHLCTKKRESVIPVSRPRPRRVQRK
mmetsp:Transcript_78953/g.205240  ORF Transcript_78953/g.205240 Transcript_78953/m.205240 type:complete len:255 (-) Transcript_78953:423-1187(-)